MNCSTSLGKPWRAVLTAVVLLAALPQSGFGQTALSPSGAAADGPAAPSNALDKKDLEFYVRHLNLWGPQIQVEISEFRPTPINGLVQTTIRASYQKASREFVYYVSKDGQHVLQGRTYNIAKNPYQANLNKITTEEQPGFGTAGAPVVIVAYSDFQCPYCSKEAKVLRNQLMTAYPKEVRVYFRDYPLKSHQWALDAAIAGRCIFQMEPDGFWKYHDWIFENQSSITPQNLRQKVAEFAPSLGVDPLKLSRCIEQRETEPIIQASIEEGRALGISSTPTIFINGRMLTGSIEWKQLKQIIDYEIGYQKITKNAGDDCGCEVEFTIPAAQ